LKIVVVGNGAISKNKDKYFKNKDKNVVRFLQDLCGSDQISDCVFLEPVSDVIEARSDNVLFAKIPDGVRLAADARAGNGWFGRIIGYLLLAKAFLSSAKDADLVYIFYYGHLGMICALLSIAFSKKYALYIRSDYIPQSRIQKMIVRNADFILANGQILLDRLGALNSRAFLVSPMIEIGLSDIYERKNYALHDPARLLIVTRLERTKGIYILLDALPSLINMGFNIKLNVVGPGPEHYALIRYAEDLGVGECIEFHGLLTDKHILQDMYKESDLFILPSFYPEGFPRVIYEAMLNSLPIITTPVGSIPSLLKHDENCIFVEPRDSADLSNKLAGLLKNTRQRRKIAVSAVSTIEAYLSQFTTNHAGQVIQHLHSGSGISR
jgi:glycosyltransferase involved in cell wall biosynthesis